MNASKEEANVVPKSRACKFYPSDDNGSVMTLIELEEIIKAAIIHYNIEPIPSSVPLETLEKGDVMTRGILKFGNRRKEKPVSQVSSVDVQNMRSKP